MKAKTTLNLKCLTVAAVALLAILPVQTGAANSPHRRAQATQESELHSATRSQHAGLKPLQPTGSGKSYFWADAGLAAAFLVGFLALGLWGDRAVGGIILGIQCLCAGAAWPVRTIGAHAAARFRGHSSPNLGRARATAPGPSHDQ